MVKFNIQIDSDKLEQAKQMMWKMKNHNANIKTLDEFDDVEVLKMMMNNLYYGVDAKITKAGESE